MTTPSPASRPVGLPAGPSLLPRVGTGVDVHPFEPGRECWMAGLLWPEEPAGCSGHSDGDVVAHAICDAVLAAAGAGDLGSLVGVDQPQWAGAHGSELIEAAANRVVGAGWIIGNVSVQMVGNRPRIGSRRAEAERALTAALGAPVALSGTTTDGLGLTGRGEGVAAVAVAVVVPASR